MGGGKGGRRAPDVGEREFLGFGGGVGVSIHDSSAGVKDGNRSGGGVRGRRVPPFLPINWDLDAAFLWEFLFAPPKLHSPHFFKKIKFLNYPPLFSLHTPASRLLSGTAPFPLPRHRSPPLPPFPNNPLPPTPRHQPSFGALPAPSPPHSSASAPNAPPAPFDQTTGPNGGPLFGQTGPNEGPPFVSVWPNSAEGRTKAPGVGECRCRGVKRRWGRRGGWCWEGRRLGGAREGGRGGDGAGVWREK